MIQAILVCNQGMSTNYLRQAIEEAAKKRGVDLAISATGVSNLDSYIDDLDVVLVGPQIRFAEKSIRETLDKKKPSVKLMNVDPTDFGLMRGEEVLTKMLSCLGV